jgi:hypothetical protein
MKTTRCKVCGQIINAGEGSAFEGVHIKCARKYLNRGSNGPVLHGDENAPQKRVDLNISGIPMLDDNVYLIHTGIPESDCGDYIDSNAITITSKISRCLYEALIAEVEKNGSSVSKYVRDIIENHLSRV